ncbi:S8 family serine peptidase [Crossiella cryophila]|uniref:Peptidase S8/S53 domain-containing protein n=1 Tax=Crossiella cryophila TaxID=43355 RepID=A0A7W7FUP2_9PSEU|nr:S8 family serine peptidase [Crossiella cryophila]MBB4678245.1 hypothetical protein [Crossiella cryophila]
MTRLPRRAAALASGVAAALALSAPVPASAAPALSKMDQFALVAAGSGARAEVYLDGDPAALAKAVRANGGEVSDTAPGRVRATLPGAALPALAANRAVREIRQPIRPIPMVVSEGVPLTNSPAWHNAGGKGAGAKVGVIDIGYGRLAAARTAGEVPASATVHNGRCGTEHISSHGTTMAEVVHDMAPEAQLFLACVVDTMDFDDAAEWLRQQGVHIVTVALGFPGTGRGDGTGEDVEGAKAPANVVRQLRAAGVLVVAAAGNEGDKHLGGRLLGSDADGWQYLNGNAQGQGFSVSSGGTVTVELKWDAWPRTAVDFDLYVMSTPAKPSGLNDPALGGRYSIRAQKGTSGGLSPVETVTFTQPSDAPGTYWAYLKWNGGARDMRYDLTVHGPAHGLSYTTPAQSIAEPASSPYALAVGAITPANQQSGGQAEGYSSRGPTVDGRVKPDLTALTNVSSYSGGSAPGATLGGTSVAAAHVAGAAAVYRGGTDLDAEHLRTLLLDAAGRQGRDNTLGRGTLHLGQHRALAAPTGNGYTPLTVQNRVLNTYSPEGGHQRPFEPGETYTLPIPGLPADAQAVVLTVTGMHAEEFTSLSITPDVSKPAGPVPTVDVRKGQIRSETVTATLNPVDKVIRIHNSHSKVNLSIDVLGYYSGGSASLFFPVRRPFRLHGPATIGANAQIGVIARGVQGIPAAATAVAVNVTTTSAGEPTEIEVFGTRRTASWTSTPYPGGKTTTSVLVPVGADNAIKLYNARGSATVTVEVTGWFEVRSGGARYVPLRHTVHQYSSGNATGAGALSSGLPSGTPVEIPVTRRDGVPGNATGAVVTASVRLAGQATDIDVWQQEHGNTGFAPLSTEALLPLSASGHPVRNNAFVTGLGPSGALTLWHSAGQAHLRGYVHGYFLGGTP